jgi:hypothetical protein
MVAHFFLSSFFAIALLGQATPWVPPQVASGTRGASEIMGAVPRGQPEAPARRVYVEAGTAAPAANFARQGR